MADSVDRVFVHALNTVKRIPRLGSARPPPSDRLRLYGLYKQSMEGDVDGVMDRPQGDSLEIRSDQEKWDAWNQQKGISRTEAKRQYISTLIETMHKYATQTQDARELVSELEFVWDQVKSNAPSTSSSHSFPRNHGGESPPSTSDPTTYANMSGRGSRAFKTGMDESSRLRVLSPVSHSQAEVGAEVEEGGEDHRAENFVDAPDSHDAEDEIEPPNHQSNTDDQEQRVMGAASALLAPITKFIARQKKESKIQVDTASQWQRRIEKALINMNTEMAALREQLEMQQNSAMYSSIIPSFRSQRRRGILRWLFHSFLSFLGNLVRHIIIDAALLALVTIWMHYRGIPLETLEDKILDWVHKIQQITLLKKLDKMRRKSIPNIKLPKSITGSAREKEG